LFSGVVVSFRGEHRLDDPASTRVHITLARLEQLGRPQQAVGDVCASLEHRDN
jgi:hypothetical protein